MSRTRSRTAHTTAPLRLRHWSLRLGAAVLAVAFLPSSVGAERAPRVQSVSELRSRADQIAAELDQLDVRTSELDEKFNDTSLEVQRLQDRLAQTRREVDAARASLDSNREAAKHYAVDAYVGSNNDQPSLFGAGGPAADGPRQAYLNALHGNREQVIESVTASQKDLRDQESSLATAKSAVDAKMSQLANSKRALSDTIARRQSLLESVNGELGAAVEAEQARRAAEAAARAEAAAAKAEVARMAAARRPVVLVAASRATSQTADSTSVSVSVSAPTSTSTSAPSRAAVSPVSSDAPLAVRVALAQQGKPYRWASAGPSSFDCSGLVMYAFGQAGVSLPHSSSALRSMTQRISADQLQPGDLVFGGSPVHHVGIYIGNGQMVHAPHSGTNVQVSSMYSTSSPVSFGRL